MHVVVSTVRGPRTPWADVACADWAARIRRHLPFEEVDGGKWKVPPRARLVVVDERGRDLTSAQFAALFDEAAQLSASHLVFAIGGAYGHDPEVRALAWKTVRLGAMVLNHAVARVVLVEQIYRACCIRAGSPYHHG